MARPRANGRPDPSAPHRPCEAPNCPESGEYRAPKDRTRLREYHWFCLAHVRAYNLSWDFYKGMAPEQIEASLRLDTGWQRPTWPLGRLGHGRLDAELLRDPFGILNGTAQPTKRAPNPDAPPPELRAALDLLDLSWPTDSLALKARYKELAKRYHPDSNGGDRSAEDRLKDINRAYSLLRHKLAGVQASAR